VSGAAPIAVSGRAILAATPPRTLRAAAACDYQHAVPSARAFHVRMRARARSARPSWRPATANGVVPVVSARVPPHRPARSLDRDLIALRI
jgi:hypothetical protein